MTDDVSISFKEVREAGAEILGLVAENQRLFRGGSEDVSSSEEAWLNMWRDYEDYIDDIISKCIQQAVGCR